MVELDLKYADIKELMWMRQQDVISEIRPPKSPKSNEIKRSQ